MSHHFTNPSLRLFPTPASTDYLYADEFDPEFFSTSTFSFHADSDPCVNFGPYGIALAIIYFVTFCAIIRHCLRNKRPRLERTFISFLLINNISRIIYFLGWGIQNHDQCPTVIIDETNRTWLSYFSNIPAHFYITAFSILVYKFSFVFHGIINISSKHRVVSAIVGYGLIFANVLSYSVAIASMVQMSWFPDSKYSWVQTVALKTLIVLSSTLAVLLFLYGNALFFTIQSYLKQVRQQWNQTEGIVAVQCDVANDLREAQAQLLHSDHNRPYSQYQSPTYPAQNQHPHYQYHNGEYANDAQVRPNSQEQLGQAALDSDFNQQYSPNHIAATSSDQLSASSNHNSSQTSHGTGGKSNSQQTSSGHQSSSPSSQVHPHQRQHPSNVRPNQIVQSGIIHQYNTMRAQHHQHQQLQFHHQQARPQAYQYNTPNSAHHINGAQTMNFQNRPNNTPRNQQSSANQFASMFSKQSPYPNQTYHGEISGSNANFGYSSNHNMNHSNQGSAQTGSSFGGNFLDADSSHSFSHSTGNGPSSSTNLQQAFLLNNGGTFHTNVANGSDRGISPSSRDHLTYLVDAGSNGRRDSNADSNTDSTSRQSGQSHQQSRVANNRRLYQNTKQSTNQFQHRPLLSNQYQDSSNVYAANDHSTLLTSAISPTGDQEDLMDSQASSNAGYDDHHHQYPHQHPTGGDHELSGLVQLPGHSYYNERGGLLFNYNPNSPSTLHHSQHLNESLLRQHTSHTGVNGQRKFSLRDNYMFKPFIVSICSSICFVIRVALLIAMSSFDVPQRPEIILLYSCCSEIIPMHLMWFVFDDPSLDKESTVSQQPPAFGDNYDESYDGMYPNEYGDTYGFQDRPENQNGGDYQQYIDNLHQFNQQPAETGIVHDSPLQRAMNIDSDNHDNYGRDQFFQLSPSKGTISTTGESTGLPHTEETYSIQASNSTLLSVPNTAR